MTVALEDMRGVSDEELLAAFRSDEHAAAAYAEAQRRDQAAANAARIAPAQQAQEAIREEWRNAALADYAAAGASMICKGTMFSPEGLANGPADEFSLWTVRESDANRWASSELREWWGLHGRLTVGKYAKQRADAIRAARDDTATEGAGYEGLARHDAGSVRRDSEAATAGTVRGGQSGQPDRSVQRGGRVNVASEAATATRVAANVGRHMAQGREAAERRLAAARSGAEMTGIVVRRPATAPARPADERIPGDQLLDLLRQWLGTYARFPSGAALDAVVLWVAHSHMRDEKGTLVFRATPRLYLLSSEPGSGKSKVLELCNMLCPATYGLTLEPTAAGLTHTIGNEHATVFIDEGDVMFGAGQRKSAVRAVINGGYERHGTMLNGKGSKATRVPVFGALALAGLDVLEKGTGDTLTALLSRGVRIRMKRAGKDDRPAKVTRATEEQGEKMKAWLEAWASQVLDGIKDYQPVMPEEVDGRPEQIWEPLVAVADAAGGEWPERARAACIELALDQATAPVEDEDKSAAEEFASFAADLGGALAGTEPEYDDDGEE